MRGYPQPPVTTLRFQNPIDRDAVLKLCRINMAKYFRILQEENFFDKFFCCKTTGGGRKFAKMKRARVFLTALTARRWYIIL